MPIRTSQNDRINALWEMLHSTSTGFRGRVEAILENTFRSTLNPFGTAAALDTGTTAGNVPVLAANGRLTPSIIPAMPASAFSGAFNRARIPDHDASKLIAAFDSTTVDVPANRLAGRIRVSELPLAIPAAAIVSGTVSESVLPAKNRQITAIGGTCVLADFRYNARNARNPSATYRPPGASADRTVQLASGRAGTNIAAATQFPGTGNVSGTTLNINAVLVTLVRSS